jgi:DNA helicase-2/ATP-dependent DNA helicase PcrA
LESFRRWRGDVGLLPHPELAEQILDQSGYTAMWRDKQTVDAPGRLENLKEMIIALEDFETLGEFMEHVSLVMENDDSNVTDKVNLMTLHGAKGLEFDTVFLAGWEEGLFPHPRTLDDSGVAGLEEERRLAYVGLTRARKQAFVTFAANRRIHGQWNSAMPSRFIDELPEDHVDIRSPTGLYGGGQAGGFSDRSGVFDNNRRQRGQWRSRPELVEDVARSSDDTDFQVGQRVFHQKFGYGKINAVDGGKLEIAFEKAGDKKVMASFVDVV